MPRKPDIDRPTVLHLMMPESLRAKIDLWLFSQVEGRVPRGAYQAFILPLIRDFFSWRRLDLNPFGFPPGYFVSGPAEMIQALERKLKENDRA